MNVNEILTKAALLLGEDPSAVVQPGEWETATLADRIRLSIEPAAAEAVLGTPKEELTGWTLLGDDGLRSMDDGGVMLPLPEDFLLLFNLRLKGWLGDVTEITPRATPAAAMQRSRCEGIRGSARKPVAVSGVNGGGRCLLLYGAHTDPPEVEDGWYLPRPKIDSGGNIAIPAAAEARFYSVLMTLMVASTR